MSHPPTPRNGLPVKHFGSAEHLAEVDTLYEIADAEFTSDKEVHDLFQRLRRTHNPASARWAFVRCLQPLLWKIAQRDSLVRLNASDLRVVSKRIYADWEAAHGN